MSTKLPGLHAQGARDKRVIYYAKQQQRIQPILEFDYLGIVDGRYDVNVPASVTL